MTIGNIIRDRDATAWFLMILALAVHVIDEAISGFLPFYNQTVLNLRNSLGFFPMPIFSFGLWFGGLIALVVIGLSLTPKTAQGGRFIQRLTLAFGIIMILNALAHLLGSIYFGRLLPGFWSSPFLLATALFMVYRRLRGSKSHNLSSC